jgi:predicted nuclease of predicted toxin-antitoxin system
MRFLADESCDFRVVRGLRAAGHDVTAVIEISPGASDEAVIELAVRERRIFITEDPDFGQLVYASGQPTAGVILLRFPRDVRTRCRHLSPTLSPSMATSSVNALPCSSPGEFD